MPQTIEVLSGSCVTIPCSFDITDVHIPNLDNTCRALWKFGHNNVVFDSSEQQNTLDGKLNGDLTKKDCTTTLNNMKPENSNEYYFKLECDNVLKYNFKVALVNILVKGKFHFHVSSFQFPVVYFHPVVDLLSIAKQMIRLKMMMFYFVTGPNVPSYQLILPHRL